MTQMTLPIYIWAQQIVYLSLQLFLGRWVVDGQRELISKFSLKNRTYIGSTSMDAQLSFIMTNCAQVQSGDTVVDPFVGTGKAYIQVLICLCILDVRTRSAESCNTLKNNTVDDQVTWKQYVTSIVRAALCMMYHISAK